MNLNNVLLIIFLSLLIASCNKEDGNGVDDPKLEPIVISGTQSAPLILERIFSNPNTADYIIDGTWRIEAPVVVEPGVRFSMTPNARIQVRTSGSLSVVGTADKPVFFEGEVDAKGYWDYIAIETNNPSNKLEHCVIRHGGGNSTSSYPGAVVVRNNSQLNMVNTLISKSQRNGLVITDNDSKIPEFRDNIITDCSLYPIVLKTSQVQFIDETTQFTSGNGFNQIEVQGSTVNTPMTINPAAGPYVFKSTTNIDAPVEILPGTIIEMGPSAKIQIRASGSLTAIGAAEKRISVTAEQDAKGYWDYIYFNGSNSPNNQFKYIDISLGGGSGLSCCGGAVSLSNAFLSLENSTITNSQRWAMRLRSNSVFEDLGGNAFSGNETGDIDD